MSKDESPAKSVDLLVFACEGREHLLNESIDAFKDHVHFSFAKTILSVDGKYEPQTIGKVNPDIVVQSRNRQGYAASIRRSLPFVESPYFFWLEDDYRIDSNIHLSIALDHLHRFEDATQIRFPLSDENIGEAFDSENSLYRSKVGFSCRPGINRTEDIKTAILEQSPGANANVEHHLIDWCNAMDRLCLMKNPGDAPYASHIGSLEATSGQWHTTEPEEEWENPRDNTSSENTASSLSRFKMVARLVVRVIPLLIKQLNNDQAHRLAWRITNAIKQFNEKTGSFRPAPAEEKDGR
jgi:hypothetical protein